MEIIVELVIDPKGTVRCIYAETIDLHVLGQPVICRASHVEPDEEGNWWADLSPVDGPRLGPYSQRSDALRGEQDWLQAHWLNDRHG